MTTTTVQRDIRFPELFPRLDPAGACLAGAPPADTQSEDSPASEFNRGVDRVASYLVDSAIEEGLPIVDKLVTAAALVEAVATQAQPFLQKVDEGLCKQNAAVPQNLDNPVSQELRESNNEARGLALGALHTAQVAKMGAAGVQDANEWLRDKMVATTAEPIKEGVKNFSDTTRKIVNAVRKEEGPKLTQAGEAFSQCANTLERAERDTSRMLGDEVGSSGSVFSQVAGLVVKQIGKALTPKQVESKPEFRAGGTAAQASQERPQQRVQNQKGAPLNTPLGSTSAVPASHTTKAGSKGGGGSARSNEFFEHQGGDSRANKPQKGLNFFPKMDLGPELHPAHEIYGGTGCSADFPRIPRITDHVHVVSSFGQGEGFLPTPSANPLGIRESLLLSDGREVPLAKPSISPGFDHCYRYTEGEFEGEAVVYCEAASRLGYTCKMQVVYPPKWVGITSGKHTAWKASIAREPCVKDLREGVKKECARTHREPSTPRSEAEAKKSRAEEDPSKGSQPPLSGSYEKAKNVRARTDTEPSPLRSEEKEQPPAKKSRTEAAPRGQQELAFRVNALKDQGEHEKAMHELHAALRADPDNRKIEKELSALCDELETETSCHRELRRNQRGAREVKLAGRDLQKTSPILGKVQAVSGAAIEEGAKELRLQKDHLPLTLSHSAGAAVAKAGIAVWKSPDKSAKKIAQVFVEQGGNAVCDTGKQVGCATVDATLRGAVKELCRNKCPGLEKCLPHLSAMLNAWFLAQTIHGAKTWKEGVEEALWTLVEQGVVAAATEVGEAVGACVGGISTIPVMPVIGAFVGAALGAFCGAYAADQVHALRLSLQSSPDGATTQEGDAEPSHFIVIEFLREDGTSLYTRSFEMIGRRRVRPILGDLSFVSGETSPMQEPLSQKECSSLFTDRKLSQKKARPDPVTFVPDGGKVQVKRARPDSLFLSAPDEAETRLCAKRRLEFFGEGGQMGRKLRPSY